MKIALLHFGFSEYTISLANGLVELVDLTLIQPEKLFYQYHKLLDPRINIRTFKKPRIRDPRNIFAMNKLIQIIREIEPDVLHIQETREFWLDLALFLNQIPPVVTTIHDVMYHPGDRERIPGADLTRWMSFRRSRQFIVHAQILKSDLTENFHIASHDIHVLPHGELGTLYDKLTTHAPLTREPHTLLFYGRIWPYKGLNYLVEAMKIVRQSLPQAKLIIAGRGENIQKYFPDGIDAQQYEILNQYIPSEQVIGLFQRSTAVILPYIEASQSGVAAIAYATGTPIIASQVGGLSEMIQPDLDGLLVPPRNVQALADAILQVLQNPDLQQRLKIASLDRCQKDLNWKNIALQTVKIYHTAFQ